MFSTSKAFSGFSVNDIGAAKAFYADTLGLDVEETNGMLNLKLAQGARVLVYPKPNHVAATYTIMNFPVANIDEAVDDLVARGVTMTRFDGFDLDERGIFRGGGPFIAWFSDPAGNVLSVLQDS
jgi:predicted enzyme related to lactoylglutathione lyase